MNLQRQWSRRGQLSRHALNHFRKHERPLDNMTLANKEGSVVDSAGFLRRDICPEQNFRETEAFDADCDEVFVREYIGLIIV